MKPVAFSNGKRLTLRGWVHVPPKYDTALIYLHGFPSSCRGFTAPRMAKVLEKTNFLFLMFDFSHTDSSDGKFENKLMSKEVADIKYAIDFLEKEYGFRRLILIGHSTGATDAALYAHKDKRITKLVLSGAVSNLKQAVRYDFTDQQVYDFWSKGHITYNRPGHWVHGKKLKKAFYDEFFTLDIPRAMKKYKRPLLLVHGENDEAVPVAEAQALYQPAHKPKKLVIIRGADHSFRNLRHFQKMMKVIYPFCKSLSI